MRKSWEDAAVEGRPPYHRRTPAETVAAIAIGDPRWPRPAARRRHRLRPAG